MKISENNSWLPALFIIVIIIQLVNVIFDIYPVLNFIKFVESKNYYWTIPTTITLSFGIWLNDRRMKKKIINERVEIFNATIRTIQDILQNSSSSIQLLILDMKDERVHDEIIKKAEKNLEELKKVITALASVDPRSIVLKDLNKNLSIIKMDHYEKVTD